MADISEFFNPVIRSMTDNDLYKFTMQQAVLETYQGTPVVYEFTDRDPKTKWTQPIVDHINSEIENMGELSLADVEADQFASMGFFSPQYIDYLSNFRYQPDHVKAYLDNGRLRMRIETTWEDGILWEVPLLGLTSEIYFRHNPADSAALSMSANAARLHEKGTILSGLKFTDFGTRRRRMYEYQNQAVEILKGYPGFQGTSNVHLARLHGVKAIGTMAHEWIMGVGAMEGLRHANRHALRAWNSVYKGRLGIALTDTFGTEAFWGDFDAELSRLYDGVRHDSADPGVFTERTIKHYKSVNVNPLHKTVVYSDGLNARLCVDLANRYGHLIGQGFGIGTHLTNDVPGSPALKIVIKLRRCNGIDVVKLGDGEGKETGASDAVRVTKYVFFGTPLDQGR